MKIDMVIIHRNRNFGIDFSKRKVEEITFDEAFGNDVFDWDNNIFVGSDYNKERYEEARGEDGCGFVSEVVSITSREFEEVLA